MNGQGNVVLTDNQMLFSHQKKEILPTVIMRMNPENLIVSEISQSQNDKYCVGLVLRGI